MKYPKLVPDRMCTTEMEVVIYGEGLSETGSPIIVCQKKLKCNYQDKAYTKLTAEQKIVTLGMSRSLELREVFIREQKQETLMGQLILHYWS